MTLRDRIIRLAHQEPSLRKHLVPILRQAEDRNSFTFEGPDFGIRVSGFGWDRGVTLYFPTSNINRKGKVVTIRNLIIENTGSTIAWAHEAEAQLRKARSIPQAEQILDQLKKDIVAAKDTVREFKEQVKGISKDLPTPKAQRVDMIKGRDITVDLNAKPIELWSKSYSDKLDEGHMTYWFRVNPQYQKRLQALAPQLEAAKGVDEAMKILDTNGIPYDSHSYMQSGWD